MKRPWQIWLLYSLCLAAALPALGWLTHQAVEVDRAEQQSRAQAELDENVSLALWRMDTFLAPLLGQEAARPYFVFRPYYTPPGLDASTGRPRRVASPLLKVPSEYVWLHFQLHADGTLISPQCPEAEAQAWAEGNGVSVERVLACNTQRDDLERALHYEQLLALLPREMLPPVDVGLNAWNTFNTALMAPEQQAAVVNDVATNKVKQQRDEADQQLQGFEQQGAQPIAENSPPPQALLALNPNPQRAQSKIRREVDAYENRVQILQNFAQSQRYSQRAGNADAPPPPPPALVSEGVSRPLWVGERLLLARKTTLGDEVLVQGCWLNWPALKEKLRSEVASFLPEVEFQPLTSESEVIPGRVLATLPVQLVVAAAVADNSQLTPIRLSLMIAWVCLALAAMAVAILLAGVVRLSERRAAFVSSVTHELRTPLTTFRMYTEMLADDMVPEEAQRKTYLRTLRAEAERLSHLVANVLAYARLERGRPTQRVAVPLGRLVERMTPRLAERASQAGLQWEVEMDAAAQDLPVRTDAGAAEQILFNLVDNAAKYAAAGPERRLQFSARRHEQWAELRVRDFGPGMAGRNSWGLFRPFSKTAEEAALSAPGVGLGLALCRRLAADLGGRLTLEHTGPEGTTFLLRLPLA